MEELTESETFIMDELPDDVRELFASLIKTYRHEIQTLKTKNKQQELKHNLHAIELIQETEKAKDIAEQGIHLLQKTIKNIKQLKTPTATALVDIQSQINEMKAFLKPQETKPSPLFSESVPIFLATKVKAKSTVIKSYQMTFRRFLEVCGDKPIRDYTGEDAGAFRAC
ncbi:hypothetical protein NO263_04980 [Gluconacetobacter entanii]|uniref:Recombinase n=1 Tax=Gluconacetobacter entanii TaxID=108528 RepID=A0ABT3K3I1_9PROT|nr:hypothetical protein [Gluconacetobacter entanii]MCW4589931.1 hypothetical protein [Gluconacetobacter entanii]MCW4594897.1 hypothetical protein [Gluconacetobacter entanii]NPC90309.1 hypothetical protein [Gluconacetobacter entanii]